jgi:anthranilate/para-aminobenzoate synthase component II
MTLLSFVILTICFAMQCTTMAMGTDIDTKTIQHGGTVVILP